MTFPQSGTLNSVQAALGTTLSAVTAWVGLESSESPPIGPSLSSYPVSLQHGALEQHWMDTGLINQFNAILSQSNYVYRI